MLTQRALKSILSRVQELRVGLLGDGCADIYWEADMRRSELSREVPHYPLPVFRERCSLGGGANVAANLAALGLRDLRFVSVGGNDWRGVVFRDLLQKAGISPEHIVFSDRLVTPAYCKPIRCGISDVRYEDPRIDFSNLSPLPEEEEKRLLEELDRTAEEADLLVVCDQFRFGCMTPAVIRRIGEIGRRLPVVVDSRCRIGEYRNVIVKPNEKELSDSLGIANVSSDDLDGIRRAASALSEKTERPVLVTLGGGGACWFDAGKFLHVSAYSVEPPIDFVGAGDAFLAGFSVAYAMHCPPEEAVSFGCLAASVTIRKIGTTGTAAPEELLAALAGSR